MQALAFAPRARKIHENLLNTRSRVWGVPAWGVPDVLTSKHLVVPQPAEAEVADPSKLVETHKYLNKHKCPVADFLFRSVVTNRVDTLATCQPYR